MKITITGIIMALLLTIGINWVNSAAEKQWDKMEGEPGIQPSPDKKRQQVGQALAEKIAQLATENEVSGNTDNISREELVRLIDEQAHSIYKPPVETDSVPEP